MRDSVMCETIEPVIPPATAEFTVRTFSRGARRDEMTRHAVCSPA